MEHTEPFFADVNVFDLHKLLNNLEHLTLMGVCLFSAELSGPTF